MLKQLETICRLNGIEYRIGGSQLLKHHGIVEVTNDIDVFVEPDQFEKIDCILSRAGEKKASDPHEAYVTTYFGEYVFERTDVDVMSSFRMKCTDGIYTHPFIEPDGQWMHLEEWVVLYTVIGREDKLASLVSYFKTNSINEGIVKDCLKRAPQSVIEEVTERFGGLMKR
ncbi:hypothetical protein PTI97_13620 [Exiguobacterium marinum]|uniref:Nucleotidyl transferase AbiEii toxin, Type IV TA system n=1 Tax=Exiguobacterium marinum TaxID=273528 RepID=A0ABY7X1A7_9BACL|nr:hypothetical protein [Exiguobacterium marinum]WDH75843.1 hypothetical protein PTI97_13620 [Exiguobacterium marinum]